MRDASEGFAPRPHDLFEKSSTKNFLLVNTVKLTDNPNQLLNTFKLTDNLKQTNQLLNTVKLTDNLNKTNQFSCKVFLLPTFLFSKRKVGYFSSTTVTPPSPSPNCPIRNDATRLSRLRYVQSAFLSAPVPFPWIRRTL